MNTDLTNLLTRQEKRVAKLIAEELAEKEIAAKLHIAYDTVHTHTRNMRRKLGVKTNLGIAIHWVLSLDKPKQFLAMFFLVLHIAITFIQPNVELRKPSASSRIVKVRKRK